jgi:hypothetical protein
MTLLEILNERLTGKRITLTCQKDVSGTVESLTSTHGYMARLKLEEEGIGFALDLNDDFTLEEE